MKRILFLMIFIFCAAPRLFASLDTTYSGNFAVPESQAGFVEEQYESKSMKKLQRGAENVFLSPLEVPHGVKTEYMRRNSEYLPVGVESFFVGTARGIGNGFKRFGVGLFEVFTFPFPQEPIVEEFNEWLY